MFSLPFRSVTKNRKGPPTDFGMSGPSRQGLVVFDSDKISVLQQFKRSLLVRAPLDVVNSSVLSGGR